MIIKFDYCIRNFILLIICFGFIINFIQINIAFRTRTKLERLLGNENELDQLNAVQLFELFNESGESMVYFLTGSFLRFTQTKYFTKFLKECK